MCDGAINKLVVIKLTESSVPYPCTFAKCKQGDECRAIERNCGRPPCPLVAICLRNSTSLINPCPIGDPVLQSSRRPFDCAPGPNGRACPRYTKCNIDPTKKYAVCCWNTNGKGGAILVDKSISSDVLEVDGVCPKMPGKPILPPVLNKLCVNKCNGDDDCLDGTKCCYVGCMLACITPVLPPAKFACPALRENWDEPCVQQCAYKTDCKPNERCCRKGCSDVCMSPQLASKILNAPKQTMPPRPGFCPPQKTIRYMECRDMEQCSRDADCFGIRKCCNNDQCGYVCVNPKSRQLHVDSWLYQWHQEHRQF